MGDWKCTFASCIIKHRDKCFICTYQIERSYQFMLWSVLLQGNRDRTQLFCFAGRAYEHSRFNISLHRKQSLDSVGVFGILELYRRECGQKHVDNTLRLSVNPFALYRMRVLCWSES